MTIRSIFSVLLFLTFVACSSQKTAPVKDETQAKVDKAEIRTRLELVVELGAVIEESNLSSADKAYLMEKFEKSAKDMVIGLAEQNKVVSAMINNLSLKNNEGMQTKRDLQKRFEDLEKENSKRRSAILNEIINTLQGRVDQEKIDKINQAFSDLGFIIIETTTKKK